MVKNDRWFVEVMFWARMGKHLDIDNVQTYNEKIQWLKVYNRHEQQHDKVDKYAVKKIVGELIGEQYIIPTLGVWNNPDEIDFDALPECFVLKATLGWGGNSVVVCTDKTQLDRKKVVKRLKKALNKQNYAKLREWVYKDIPPRVIAEAYIGTDKESVPPDYKFFCFNGRALYVMVCVGRGRGNKKPRFYFFDREWHFCPFNKVDVNMPVDFTLPRPEKLDEMFAIADKLCADEPHVRVDLYYVEGKIYFGEITYFNASGYDRDISEETDCYFGSLIKLPSPSYRP